MTPFAKKILLTSLLVLGISLCVYGGLLYEVNRQDKKVKEQARAHAESVARDQQFAELEKMYIDSEENRKILSEFVVAHEDVAYVLALIEGAARHQGLEARIKSVEVVSIEDVTNFETLNISLELSGAYDKLQAFLPVIESLPYQSEVMNVSLSQTNELGEGVDWRGVLEVAVVKKKPL